MNDQNHYCPECGSIAQYGDICMWCPDCDWLDADWDELTGLERNIIMNEKNKYWLREERRKKNEKVKQIYGID